MSLGREPGPCSLPTIHGGEMMEKLETLTREEIRKTRNSPQLCLAWLAHKAGDVIRAPSQRAATWENRESVAGRDPAWGAGSRTEGTKLGI